MKGENNFILAISALTVAFVFFPILMNVMSDDLPEVKECELEWVECSDEDLVSDCELYEQEIVTGPYWDETTETKITLRKQICRE